uniref:Acetoacetyl-CoA synthetase n=1 Tax=Callorhinchus milii TaxID=7868 RepID=A0A4W3H9I2_CALMI
LSRSQPIMESKVLWYPDSKRDTHMDRFRELWPSCFLANYSELYHWSVDNYAEFWAEFWKFSGFVYSRNYNEVIDRMKTVADLPEWFSGSRLNYAENLLRHKEEDKVALYAAGEGTEEVVKVTFKELKRRVALYAVALRRAGVNVGDRVLGYLPNSVHAVEAMLATASIGAIWSATSPDFGVNGVLDRVSQIQPKVMFSVDAVVYNGKEHNHMEKLLSVVKGLPDLKKVVLIPYVRPRASVDLSRIPHGIFLDDFLLMGKGCPAPQLEFEQLPFNHPLFIMYSSGTTGAPKCMVHSAGGTLIQHMKEHILHGNMKSSDVILYYTTTGWMMWNWLISALCTGASVVLYDGSPLVPSANVLWDLIDRLGITILGTGAKWLSVLEEKKLKPAETHSLQTLHTILSTGSPLKPQSYDYVYQHIKSSVLLGSISGEGSRGTSSPSLPLSLPLFLSLLPSRLSPPLSLSLSQISKQTFWSFGNISLRSHSYRRGHSAPPAYSERWPSGLVLAFSLAWRDGLRGGWVEVRAGGEVVKSTDFYFIAWRDACVLAWLSLALSRSFSPSFPLALSHLIRLLSQILQEWGGGEKTTLVTLPEHQSSAKLEN